MFYEPFEVSKKNEFFISVAKKGIHSFMMLGVIDNDGSPRLLARAGKTNSIDADIDSGLKITAKAVGGGTLARIADEGVVRRENFYETINYSAYSINYEQAKEFLGLIAELERKQFQDPEIVDGIIRNYIADEDNKVSPDLSPEDIKEAALNDAAIEAYVPIETEDSDTVTFEHSQLRVHSFLTAEEQKMTPLLEASKQIQISNTCRSTALNVIEAVLGFATNISKLFFIDPDYTVVFKGGNPDKQTFYILPPPPLVKKGEFSDAQFAMLEEMHKRLEEIPKSHPDDPKTRAKFDALKETYHSIFGENKLSASALLTKLNDHAVQKKEALFDNRAQNVVSKALGFTSSTERMFVDMKDKLMELKKEEQAAENTSSITPK